MLQSSVSQYEYSNPNSVGGGIGFLAFLSVAGLRGSNFGQSTKRSDELRSPRHWASLALWSRHSRPQCSAANAIMPKTQKGAVSYCSLRQCRLYTTASHRVEKSGTRPAVSVEEEQHSDLFRPKDPEGRSSAGGGISTLALARHARFR